MTYKSGTWGDKAKQRSQSRNEYFRKYKRTRDKKKIAARNAVFTAIKNGNLKPEACADFSEECRGRVEAHHHDYSKPLSVTWLCSKHHRERDAAMRHQGNATQCLNCGVDILFPKKKYCSDKCNLAHWRKKKTKSL